METSLFIAQIIGPMYLAVAASLAFNSNRFSSLAKDIMKNDAFLYYGGILALVFGLVIVRLHNLWEWEWFVIVTLIGWIGIVKGLSFLIFPEQTKKLTLKMLGIKNNGWYVVITLALGLILSYFGYVA